MKNIRRSFLRHRAQVNFFIFVNDKEENKIYIQGQDIQIAKHILPSIIKDNRITQTKNGMFYTIKNKEKYSLKKALKSHDIAYIVVKLQFNTITLLDKEGSAEHNQYLYYRKDFLAKKSEQRKLNKKVVKIKPKLGSYSTANSSTVKKKPRKSILVKAQSKTHSPTGSYQTVHPHSRIRETNKADLNRKIDAIKDIQKNHRINKPDPEKISWDDMRGQRYRAFFDD